MAAKKKKSSSKVSVLLYFVSTLVLLVVLIGMGSYFVWRNAHPTAQQKPQTTEKISMTGKLLDDKGKVVITQVVPIQWQAKIVAPKDLWKNELPSDLEPYFGIFQYMPYPKNKDPYLGNDPNTLTFSDISAWLRSTSADLPVDGMQYSLEEKQAYVDFLINLRQAKVVDLSQCIPRRGGDSSNTCWGSFKMKYVESADKVLSGYAAFVQGHQAVEYFPLVFVYLAGKLPNGSVIYAQGWFQVFDKLSQSLIGENLGADQNAEKIGEAWRTLEINMPQDDQEIYDQIIKSIDSITVRYTP